MLIDMNITEFLNETASNSPAPGGGSVSALAGALGAALSSMVGALSIGKDTDDEMKAKFESMVEKARDLMNKLNQGIDKDTEAFNKVMASFKLPKSTDEEKEERSKAIQKAMKGAADLPYETSLHCLKVMELSLEMLKHGNKNAASDASVSGLLAYAAVNGALYNVKINLNSIKDVEYTSKMREEIERISSRSEELLLINKQLSKEIIG